MKASAPKARPSRHSSQIRSNKKATKSIKLKVAIFLSTVLALRGCDVITISKRVIGRTDLLTVRDCHSEIIIHS